MGGAVEAGALRGARAEVPLWSRRVAASTLFVLGGCRGWWPWRVCCRDYPTRVLAVVVLGFPCPSLGGCCPGVPGIPDGCLVCPGVLGVLRVLGVLGGLLLWSGWVVVLDLWGWVAGCPLVTGGGVEGAGPLCCPLGLSGVLLPGEGRKVSGDTPPTQLVHQHPKGTPTLTLTLTLTGQQQPQHNEQPAKHTQKTKKTKHPPRPNTPTPRHTRHQTQHPTGTTPPVKRGPQKGDARPRRAPKGEHAKRKPFKDPDSRAPRGRQGEPPRSRVRAREDTATVAKPWPRTAHHPTPRNKGSEPSPQGRGTRSPPHTTPPKPTTHQVGQPGEPWGQPEHLRHKRGHTSETGHPRVTNPLSRAAEPQPSGTGHLPVRAATTPSPVSGHTSFIAPTHTNSSQKPQHKLLPLTRQPQHAHTSGEPQPPTSTPPNLNTSAA